MNSARSGKNSARSNRSRRNLEHAKTESIPANQKFDLKKRKKKKMAKKIEDEVDDGLSHDISEESE